MEQNDWISSLLNDPEKLQSALSMASSLLVENPAPASGETQPDTAQKTRTAAPAKRVAATMPDTTQPDAAAELMQRAMPVLAAIAQSGQHAVSPEKRNLLLAVKPFVTDNIGAQIDHGLRLMSMARMARSAMRELGGAAGRNGGNHV